MPDDERKIKSGTLAALATGNRLTIARAYARLGISCFPIRPDASKAPGRKGYREFNDRLPTDAELVSWFRSDWPGIAACPGSASGNLFVFDFEGGKEPDPFEMWCKRLTSADLACFTRCPLVRTPSGGHHLHVRTTAPLVGTVLARCPVGKVLIESRGCKHLAALPGSPTSCHRLNKPYVFVRLGWMDGQPAEPVPVETVFDWTLYAAKLNRYERPRRVVGDFTHTGGSARGDRPGDHFNKLVGWDQILTRHGWSACGQSNGTTFWRRPGKMEGVSATTGYCKSETAGDLLYVFSSSAAPFEHETAYSRLATYAILDHGGDFRGAARALAAAGYGTTRPRIRWGVGA